MMAIIIPSALAAILFLILCHKDKKASRRKYHEDVERMVREVPMKYFIHKGVKVWYGDYTGGGIVANRAKSKEINGKQN